MLADAHISSLGYLCFEQPEFQPPPLKGMAKIQGNF